MRICFFALRNTELFGKEMLPHLRDMWPGHVDRWWPTGAGLDGGGRAAGRGPEADPPRVAAG